MRRKRWLAHHDRVVISSVPSPNGLANADLEFVWTPISPSTGRADYRRGKTLEFQTTKTQTSQQMSTDHFVDSRKSSQKNLYKLKSPRILDANLNLGSSIPNLDFSACGCLIASSGFIPTFPAVKWDRYFAILRPPSAEPRELLW